jgi:hypothetical protein
MLPELAPWKFILGRITTVSAYVQEGNKREIVTANFDDTCDIELFGNFSFNFGAHFTAMKI